MAPITLDDVSSIINQICGEHLRRCKDAETVLHNSITALTDAVKASPDLDHDEVASIVFGRIKRLLNEVVGAIG